MSDTIEVDTSGLPVVHMSRRDILMGLAVGTVVPLTAGCTAHNPALGRSQLMLVSDAQIAQLSQQTWQQALQQERVSTNANHRRQVNRVGQRIATGSGMTQHDWEFVVLDNNQVNAWVLPNGKVAIYSGMLDVIDNDDHLATVIGHEAGHVAGRHAQERASQQMAAGVGAGLAAIALDQGGVDNAGMWAGVLGAGLTFGVLLPYSRRHEYEADRLGTDFMARANYRPSESLTFWNNMMARSNAGAPPAFLSTHPSDAQRVQALQSHIRSSGYA
ncbi:MAG: M48 family metallopeptidase [Oceanicaulis sp.]|uniref:M48 family metallopeptidase n=1 Tax=Glycocaulis sp. TaxID=1969725 RepID=UPI0025C38F29|nr:M48 family metallopeptidase [Glycocaulis sp.]MCC5980800.1 M48 family metallopeptidase [Oceanicaulis sp.]MCH8521631.1 M48 family metallopeptidase [Glycocaulis sp.]